MAWRGAIAISKGIRLRKLQEEKKSDQKKKNQQSKFKKQTSLFPDISSRNSEFCSIGLTTHNTDEGMNRFSTGFSRQQTYGGLGLVRTGSCNSLYRRRNLQNSWCDDVCENSDESSITSAFQSSLGIHRTPSNGFEDYTKRREFFLARIGGGEPQDFQFANGNGEKKELTEDDRKRLEAYEERKKAKEE